jgi:hypothetical protein
MPKGPQGQKRPSDVIGNAVLGSLGQAIAPYQAITIAADPSPVTRWGQSGKSDVSSL